jgi:hypothetical protein
MAPNQASALGQGDFEDNVFGNLILVIVFVHVLVLEYRAAGAVLRTEDDYEPPSNPEAKLMASANITVLNKNESSAWTNDSLRIRVDVMETSDT